MRLFLNLTLALIAVTFLAVNFVFFQVDATEAAVVTQFGEPVRVITDPGLYIKPPEPIQSVERINMQIQVYNLPRTEFLTGDKKNIVIEAYATWRVTDPLLYLTTVRDPIGAETRLADIIASEMGAAIGQMELSELVTVEADQSQLAEILTTVTEGAADRSLSLGLAITDVRFKQLTFPDANLNSVFQRMRAEREAIARQFRSEGTEEAARIRAEADAERSQILADANQQAAEIRGQADAEAISIYAAAFGRDPEFYQFIRTLAAYEIFIDENTTLILPADSELLKFLQFAVPELIPEEIPGNSDEEVQPQ